MGDFLSKNLKNMSNEELTELSKELRFLVTEVTYKNGGHLASNLGVVELTVALHKVFDFKTDKLLFDVGHQCYAHKILTRGEEAFRTIRKKGGLSGFPNPTESEFDPFYAGHASTSLSLAVGLMRARKLCGENYEIISVLGDGALGGGMCYEALNDASTLGEKQIIVLNDNNMTISPTVGLMAKNLSDRKNTKEFFERFGFTYVDGVDGHDFSSLIPALEAAKKSETSVVVRVLTKKGMGDKPSSDNPEGFHSVQNSEKRGKTYSRVAGDAILKAAEKCKNLVAVTCAMKQGVGLEKFSETYPDRFVDVGIAEEHAATMCAAMAKGGLKPYLMVYGSFMQRAFDQLMTDVALPRLPVTVLMDRAGLVEGDGETHQGISSPNMFNLMPNFTVCAPKNKEELEKIIDWSLTFDGPLVVKYPKSQKSFDDFVLPVRYGKWDYHKGEDFVDGYILTSGAVCYDLAVKVAGTIIQNGLNLSTVNAKFIKPLDTEALDLMCKNPIIIIEDEVSAGSLSESVLAYFCDNKINAKVIRFVVPDKFYPTESEDELLESAGLTVQNITKRILDEIR